LSSPKSLLAQVLTQALFSTELEEKPCGVCMECFWARLFYATECTLRTREEGREKRLEAHTWGKRLPHWEAKGPQGTEWRLRPAKGIGPQRPQALRQHCLGHCHFYRQPKLSKSLLSLKGILHSMKDSQEGAGF
jgi:hypothetical protein